MNSFFKSLNKKHDSLKPSLFSIKARFINLYLIDFCGKCIKIPQNEKNSFRNIDPI